MQENQVMRVDQYGGEDPRLLPIYSISEVAHHLRDRVPPSTVRSWVKSREGSAPFTRVIIPADGRGSMLSFQNLTEVHVLSSLRKYDIPLHRIREAIGYMRLMTQSEHPLADVQLHTDRSDIFAEVFGALISLTKRGQVAMRPLLEPYMQRIDRDVSGKLLRLYPFTDDSDGPRVVAIDPLRKFGKPYLVDVGVETSAVASRYKAGELIPALAKDFDATEEQITGALRFERALKSAA